jgi:hypothetical protein
MLDLGLARFRALSRIDLLADSSTAKPLTYSQCTAGPAAYSLFVLTPATLGHLSELAPTLSALRLEFDELSEVLQLSPFLQAHGASGASVMHAWHSIVHLPDQR